MESTESTAAAVTTAIAVGFTLSDSMESTERDARLREAAGGLVFHPKRLDGEY